MPNTRIKICGITRPEDAALAAELGAHAIGLNFVGGPRQLTWQQGSQLIAKFRKPPTLHIVSLLGAEAAPDPAPVNWNCQAAVFAATDFVQLYHFLEAGTNPHAALHRFHPKLWTVNPIASRADLASLRTQLLENLAHCPLLQKPLALVLDTAKAGALGGTGESFDWHWIAQARAAGELEGLPPIILAGGLTPENVAAAIRIAQPYAVDVSSGVEVKGKPGLKDAAKMRDFVQAARGA